MQVLAFNSRLVDFPTIRTKIKRRFKEAVRLIITRGLTAGESRRGPKLVFCEDAGVDNSKWITTGALLFHVPTFLTFLEGFVEDVLHAVCGTA